MGIKRLASLFLCLGLAAGAHGADFSTVNNARANMQKAYALETGRQIISALDTYRKVYQQPAPDEIVEWLAFSLLNNGQDPLVQSVFYLPEQTLRVKMQSGTQVEVGLRGVEFPFKYEPAIQKWVLDTENYPPTAPDRYLDPNPTEDIQVLMNLISYWCQTPEQIPPSIGVPAPMNQHTWCNAWYFYVWPRL